MEVLNSARVAAEFPQLIKSLSPEEQDVLMKYLYAGMAAPEQNNSGHLLAWHEKVHPHFLLRRCGHEHQ
jgi:actin related protein 2/3 complex subunit 5